MDAIAGSIVGFVLGIGLAVVGMRVSAVAARLDRKLDALIRHAGIDLPKLAAEEAAALARAGKKIEAIKLYREYTGCSLAEAKEKVESLVPV
jgi:ribosomal protein L7/L12